jgi:hypothetical protein
MLQMGMCFCLWGGSKGKYPEVKQIELKRFEKGLGPTLPEPKHVQEAFCP